MWALTSRYIQEEKESPTSLKSKKGKGDKGGAATAGFAPKQSMLLRGLRGIDWPDQNLQGKPSSNCSSRSHGRREEREKKIEKERNFSLALASGNES